MTKRASIFQDDVIEELLARTSEGEPLAQICGDKHMPARATVYDWIEENAELAGRFQRARVRGVHYLAEDCLAIADEPAKDAVEVANKRVRIDTRLRLAGKWLPAVYGEKVDVNHSGEVVTRHDLSRYTPDELTALESLISKASEPAGDPSGESPPGPGSVH